MNITVIGTGYVGLVAGTCFSNIGHEVWCIDTDKEKIKKLKKGIIPIYEPGLDSLVVKNQKENRLHFTDNFKEGFNQSLFVFIAVGTPQDEDGSADLKNVLAVAKSIGENLNDYKIIVNKSTVPVGTFQKIRQTIDKELKNRKKNIKFDIVSNPEFLKEGDAINDFMTPNRIIVGIENNKTKGLIQQLYSGLFRDDKSKIIFMDIKSAEITKYAANAMLATKISFINEIANLCEKVGADIEMVRKGIGSDKRIGYHFIYPGIGYGGSCFPKDIKALIHTGIENECEMSLIKAIEKINQNQKEILFNKIEKYFESKKEKLKNKKIAIWGLSFKPETNDMREAPSIVIIKKLIEAGVKKIKVHDPEALEEAKKILKEYKNHIEFFKDQYECLKNCDALSLLTEWKIYKNADIKKVKKNLKHPVIFDGRNQFEPLEMKKKGFQYFSIGR